MVDQITSIAAILQNTRIPEPVTVTLSPPPELSGVLDPRGNDWLAKAKQYASGLVPGPDSMVIHKEHVYTGLSDGWMVQVQPVRPNGGIRKILRMSTRACSTSPSEAACGRPLGMREDKDGYLIVADPYKGIFRIDPDNGRHEKLVDSKTLVNNRPVGYISDLAVASDNTIFFTSASSKWSHAESLNILLEGDRSGRVLVLRPHEQDPQKRLQELVTKLSFPDGVQLAKDESYLLIAERARARIYKAHIGNTAKRGTIEPFAANLPGFVSNIRLSPRGTYWVALSSVRHRGQPSVLDRLGHSPNRRRELMARPAAEVLRTQFPRYGLVLELNERGEIIRSLHDPNGTVFSSVSEVQESGDFLFVVSLDKNYIGLLRMSDILVSPPPVHNVVNTTAKPVTPAPSSGKEFINRTLTVISQRLLTMSAAEIQDALVKLVFLLIEATLETRRAAARLMRVENALLQLRARFNSGLTSHQKSLVRSSWAAYNTGPGVMEDTLLIFVRMFNETPDAVTMFSYVSANSTSQEELRNNTRVMGLVSKLVSFLQSVVTNLDNPSALASLARQLGARHAGYGVQLWHFWPFRAGIFDAFEKRLGSSFTLEIRQAWEALLDNIVDYMKEGMNAPRKK